MRFLARRLLFYLLAFFAAITLNFLLPRLMPGSPLDGLILRYGDAIRNNPDVLKQLQASLGGSEEPIWSAYPKYLCEHVHGEPRRLHVEPGARHRGDPEHAAVVDLPGRCGLRALVRHRDVPRRARCVASGRLRRHGRDADADGPPVRSRPSSSACWPSTSSGSGSPGSRRSTRTRSTRFPSGRGSSSATRSGTPSCRSSSSSR